MPIRVDRIEPIKIQHRNKKGRNTNGNKYYFRRISWKYRYSGNNVMRNHHLNSWNAAVLKIIDKASPFMNKHPKFAIVIMKFGEKILKKSDI